MRASVVALFAVLVLPTAALAEEPVHRVALSPELVMPFGAWSDGAGPGAGLNLVYAYDTGLLSYTGRVGYITHLGRERDFMGLDADLHSSEIPILAGARFALPFSLYGHLEAGVVHTTWSVEQNSVTKSDSGLGLGGAFGLGYHLESLDVGLRLFSPDILGRDADRDLSTAITFNLVWNFLSI